MVPDQVADIAAATLSAAGASIAVLVVAASIGIARRDNSVVDVFWGPAILAAAIGGVLAATAAGPLAWLAVAMVAAWAVRLSVHIGRRMRRAPGEDWRYARWRASWGRRAVLRALAQVYALQALLAALVSTCVVVIATSPDQRIGPLAVIGIATWALGLGFEARADLQLARFLERRRAGSASGLCRDGLWAHSRHPNYFGEALVWWGVALLVLDAGVGMVGTLAFVSPLLVTVLVRYVSGVPILERAWRDRPGFDDWAAQVPIFVPQLRAATFPPHDPPNPEVSR